MKLLNVVAVEMDTLFPSSNELFHRDFVFVSHLPPQSVRDLFDQLRARSETFAAQ